MGKEGSAQRGRNEGEMEEEDVGGKGGGVRSGKEKMREG